MGPYERLRDGVAEQTDDYREGLYPFSASTEGRMPRALSWWSPLFNTYVTAVEYDSESSGLAVEVPAVSLTPDQALAATMPLPESPYDFVCPRCGCRFETVDVQGFPTIWLDKGPVPPRFCPNCGYRREEPKAKVR